ncbi:hypothetical protein [Dyadobacter sp. MSC1_007]|jgi:hypothetical protein|uniref:hypothetical protein n=1 Tax=Dyadobacter sp. MSC1_007 TaxID=2909264 RepID=UPI00202F62B7|nr:hypothetical protein [Dyadobacter sp. MSC1_007]
MNSKFSLWFNEKWKDPVWSKVIAAGICAVCGIMGTAMLLLWKTFDPKTFTKFWNLAVGRLNGRLLLPLWAVILVVLLIPLLFSIIRMTLRYKESKRIVKPERNPVLDAQVGNYTFEELYNILRSERLRTQTARMDAERVAAPETVLLSQFLEKYDEFKIGISGGEKFVLRAMGEVNIDDGGYTFDVLAPKLMEYGLLAATETDHSISGRPEISFKIRTYKISVVGYAFRDCLEAFLPKYERAIYRVGK